jgi:hypothetical protein
MNLISIDALNQDYLGYEDERSVLKWLKDQNITTNKIGKRIYVDKDEIDNLLSMLFLKPAMTKEMFKPAKLIGTSKEKEVAQKLLDRIHNR